MFCIGSRKDGMAHSHASNPPSRFCPTQFHREEDEDYSYYEATFNICPASSNKIHLPSSRLMSQFSSSEVKTLGRPVTYTTSAEIIQSSREDHYDFTSLCHAIPEIG